MGLLMFLFIIMASFFHVVECTKLCDPVPASCGKITLPGGRFIQLVPRLVSTQNDSDPILGKLASWRHFVCTLPDSHEAQTDASPLQEILGVGSSTTRSPGMTVKNSTITSSETTTKSTTDNSPETTTRSPIDNTLETTTESTTNNSPEAIESTTNILPESTTESKTETSNASSCKMLYSMGYQTSGVYSIVTSGVDAIDVYCDMISDGGGWTVFQKRYDGSVNFYRNYAEYVQGFGDVSGEYWLGLDFIYSLAKNGVELRIDMVDYSKNQVYAHYGHFSIGSPITNYQLTFASYSGTAGEGLGAANAQGFTTYDLDNDNSEATNCAMNYQGAWWYQSCYTSNLNGVYGIQNELRGIVWNWPESKFMASTEMKLRESS